MRQSLIMAATAAFVLFGSVPAFADSFEDHMNDGVKYFKDGNYIKAIESFSAAQRIKNIPDIPYNIARSYQKLGDCDNALKYFREYALVDAEKAEKVKPYIEELTSQCGTKTGSIQMRCIPDNAFVYIDSNELVQCNGIYELGVGSHSLKFMADGYVDENRTVEIVQDSRKTVVVDMVAQSGNRASDMMASSNAGTNGDTAAAGESGEGAPLTPLFWGGVGTAGGGLLFSVIGVSMVATSHRVITYNKKTFYERSTPKLVGGGVMAGIGLAALTAGVTVLVVERIKVKNGTNSVAVVPSIAVTPDAASAGVAITF
ncbi:MAG: PEGA domain-containing protein [Proteobacteria bacterium]|nr:PEGA domain-containing protein [Pseudomonadota bacterium]